jgi:acylphosphatase
MAPSGLHVFVSGRVQGIGFRFFVQFEAGRRKLTGFVRNLPEREVEIMAVGAKKDLESFWSAVRTNHPFARIDKVSLDWIEKPESFKGFGIRY